MAVRWKTPHMAAGGLLLGAFTGVVPVLTGEFKISLNWLIVVSGLSLTLAVVAAIVSVIRNMVVGSTASSSRRRRDMEDMGRMVRE